MKTIFKGVLAAMVLAGAATFTGNAPAQADTRFGVYVGSDGYYAGYRDRHRHWRPYHRAAYVPRYCRYYHPGWYWRHYCAPYRHARYWYRY